MNKKIMAESDRRRTVLKRLAEIAESESVKTLMAADLGIGRTDADPSAGDYLTAMKLSGGEIAVRATDSVGPIYYSRRSDGMLKVHIINSDGKPLYKNPVECPPSDIRNAIRQSHTEVRMVPVENTPFDN